MQQEQKIRKTAADLRRFTWRDLTVILSYLPLQFITGIIVMIPLMASSLVANNMDIDATATNTELIAKSSIYGMFLAGLITSIFIVIVYFPLLKDDWKKFTSKIWPHLGLIAIGYILTIVAHIITNMLITIPESQNQAVLESMFASSGPLEISLLVISTTFFAPLGEEFLCRKAIFGSFFHKKIVASIMFVVSSLVFGLLHYGWDGQLLSLIPYVLMGATMAAVYWKTQNIFLPIGVHFVNNFIASLAIIVTVLN